MPMKNPRLQRRYVWEFKQEAVRLLITSGRPFKELPREPGTTRVSLLKWKAEALCFLV